MLRLSQILKEVLPTPLFLRLKAAFWRLEAARAEVQLELRRAITKFRSNDRIFGEIYRTNVWGGRTVSWRGPVSRGGPSLEPLGVPGNNNRNRGGQRQLRKHTPAALRLVFAVGNGYSGARSDNRLSRAGWRF
jgi:hypothetical protein